MSGRFILALIVVLGSPALAWPAIRGQVLAPNGEPVASARVEAIRGAHATLTDDRGRFRLDQVTAPTSLVVTHPRYAEITVEVGEEPSDSIEVRLVPRTTIHDALQVSALRAGSSLAPASLSSTPIDPHRDGDAASLTEALVQVPGVSENGQGGRLQVFSIRGVSRHRVLNLVAGARLTGERRAGVSTSFLDPLLVGEIDVLRGPASTHFGSGALGGAVEIEPRRFEGGWLRSGYTSHGDETVHAVGWGGKGFSLGLARRQAGDGRARDGAQRNDRYEQLSASLRKTWSSGEQTTELLVLPAYGEDLGKASTDFPQRATRYPYERHLLVRLLVDSSRGLRLSGFVHPRRLDTEVANAGGPLEEVESESFDFGGRWERPLFVSRSSSARSRKVDARLGVDYFGRRGVEIRERASGLGCEALACDAATTLDDGSEDEAAGFGVAAWKWGKARLEAGGRLTLSRQANGGMASRQRSAITGFAGMAFALPRGVELVANLGTGHRFPSLSEQFFSGVTGRGRVIGNPGLESETSVNTELGLRWFGRRAFVRGSVFRNRIQDYVERIELSPDLLTSENLVSGVIQGVEIEGLLELDRSWRLEWGAHSISGRDRSDRPLGDVPPDHLRLGVGFDHRRWRLNGELRWRRQKGDPGSGEKEIPSAFLVATSLRFDVGGGVELYLSGKNLLDEAYFPSADRKSPQAVGRSVGFGIGWSAR